MDDKRIKTALVLAADMAQEIAANEPQDEFESKGNWQYYLRMIQAIEQKTNRTFAQLITLNLIALGKSAAADAGKIHFGI